MSPTRTTRSSSSTSSEESERLAERASGLWRPDGQAGPTSNRLQKRGKQRRGAEDHDPKCEPWQKRNVAIPPNPKTSQKDGIAGPALATVVRIRAREVVWGYAMLRLLLRNSPVRLSPTRSHTLERAARARGPRPPPLINYEREIISGRPAARQAGSSELLVRFSCTAPPPRS